MHEDTSANHHSLRLLLLALPPGTFDYAHATRTGITLQFHSLQKLSEVLGFTYSLRATPAGTATPDTITMVRNGSADMTGSWITITSERSEYVAFTYPYFDLGIAFVYKPDSNKGVRKRARGCGEVGGGGGQADRDV